MKENPTII